MKAFDTVPHRRLLMKARSYGLSEQVVGWIGNFLKGRWQKVMVNGAASDWREVTSGIPQGSVFVIYINDLPEKLESGILLFADDTKIYNTIRKEEDRETWSDYRNGAIHGCLRFHPEKCNTPEYTLSPGGQTHKIQETESEKDLGVIFDRTLSFEEHINTKVKNANMMVGLIRSKIIQVSDSRHIFFYHFANHW